MNNTTRAAPAAPAASERRPVQTPRSIIEPPDDMDYVEEPLEPADPFETPVRPDHPDHTTGRRPTAGGVSTEQLARARQDPLVEQVVELFSATVMNVQPRRAAPAEPE